MDLCSIVVPTHNRRERLLKTLRTIRNQTYPAIEIIVSDDGSADDTAAAVDQLGDHRVSVVRSETATGVANARNRGVAASSGKWVAFCDDDDFWAPDKIADQVEAMNRSGARWAICGAVSVTDDLEFILAAHGQAGPEFADRLEFGNKVRGGCSSAVMERTLFDEVGGFDPAFSMFADWDLWIRAAERGHPTTSGTFGVLYVHHQGQMSFDMSKIEHELDLFRKKHAEARAGYSRQMFEPIDMWIVRRSWLAKQYGDSLRHAVRSQGPLGVVASAASIAITYRNKWMANRSDNRPPEAMAVLERVRRDLLPV